MPTLFEIHPTAGYGRTTIARPLGSPARDAASTAVDRIVSVGMSHAQISAAVRELRRATSCAAVDAPSERNPVRSDSGRARAWSRWRRLRASAPANA